jgi:hypothetical protein
LQNTLKLWRKWAEMASRTKAKPSKGRDGTGKSVTVFFDVSDPAEHKALQAARLLAAKHGRRKQAIIALLEAVYDHYEDSGLLMTSAEITAALMGQPAPAAHGTMGFAPATGQIVASDASAAQRRAGQQRADNAPGIVVTAGGKASARTVADNFLRSFSGQFFD